MEKKLFVFISCVLLSCAEATEEKAIKDFLQTYDNSKLDLEVDIIQVEEIGMIRAIDSIYLIDSIIFQLALIEKVDLENYIDERYQEIERDKEALAIRRRYESPEIYRIYKIGNDKLNKLNEELIETFQEKIDRINNGLYYNLTSEIQDYYKVRSRYESNPDKIIAIKYRCKYKFNNPLLNGIRQETTDTFVFDTLKFKVLKRL